MNNTDKAKTIFLNYACSSFHMSRDGILQEYSSYGISREQEEIWKQEMFEKSFESLNIFDETSVSSLGYLIEHHGANQYFERYINALLQRISEIDNKYMVLRFAENIFFILENLNKNSSLLSRDEKIFGLNAIETLVNIAKVISLPAGYSIPNITFTDNNQDQYINRKLIDIEYKLNIARILK